MVLHHDGIKVSSLKLQLLSFLRPLNVYPLHRRGCVVQDIGVSWPPLSPGAHRNKKTRTHLIHVARILADIHSFAPYSRFGGSSLHQRDPRSALFENYNGGGASEQPRTGSASPSRPGGYSGYGYSGGAVNGSSSLGVGLGAGEQRTAYRPATPNSR